MPCIDTSTAARCQRKGLTLLEVLVACGLLAIGLTTMAAILPAAGSRLAQAHLEDRASTLATNALADLMNRQLVSADSFLSPTTHMLAFGQVLGALPRYGELPVTNQASDSVFTSLSPEGQFRLGSFRTFFLEDDLVYAPAQVADTPSNSFAIDASGNLGPRLTKPGICWGATIGVTATGKVEPGQEAVLSVVIFKKDGTVDPNGNGVGFPVMLTRRGDVYQPDITAETPVLRACSWILAVPSNAQGTPAWHQIVSSWVFKPPLDTTPRLVIRDQDGFAGLTGTESDGSRALVFAFDGIVRLDQHPIKLR